MKRLFFCCSIIFLSSCYSSSKVIKYPTISNDVFANNNLKNFLKINPSPSIVLRTPNSSDKVTSNTSTTTNNNLLYNTIEKELLRENFSVRDRGLFNEIIDKSTTTDYSKIKDLTNTDLILEVVNIDPEVIYKTNKITEISKKGKEVEKTQSKDYTSKGISVEFKLIMVKNNEIAGTYKYYYKPCPDGCELNKFGNTKKHSSVVELKEGVAIKTEDLEDFMTKCTQDLVKSFRNG